MKHTALITLLLTSTSLVFAEEKLQETLLSPPGTILLKGESMDFFWLLDDHGCPFNNRFSHYEVTQNGKKVAEKYVYTNSKTMAYQPFLNGVAQGVAKYWSTKGVLLTEVPYHEGKMHGKTKFYSFDGKLLGTSDLVAGTGTYRSWKTWGDHSVSRTRKYENGKLISVDQSE